MRYTTRLTLIFGLIWALLLAFSITASYFSLRAGLETHVLHMLAADAAKLAKLYDSGASGELPATGGTYISIYDFSGNPLVLEEPEHRLPAAVLKQASEKEPRLYRSRRFAAAYIATAAGILAVSQDLTFIWQLTRNMARTATLAFLLALPLGWLLVRFGVRWASRPLAAAAEAIADRSGADLSPIPYSGPADDELGRIIARFNGLLEELQSARERERVFLAEVSHELRTPLTVLLGYLDRLRKNPGDAEALAAAERTGKHLTRLVGDLLALARGEAERGVNPHIVDLAELARGVAAGFPGVSFEAHAHPEVLGDPDRLTQMLRNLIANAVRAAGRGDGVRVVVGAGENAWLEVHDDGPGIDPEVLPRLFERFARGPEGGTGLGLAIAKQIAEAHEGRITVRSRPGQTVFRVELPGLEGEE